MPQSICERPSLVSEPRSHEARQRAEDALVRFALLAGTHTQEFVVIGGLNPDFLAPGAPVRHQGTSDVDILLELGFVYDRDEDDYGWLEEALTNAGFIDAKNGWRWKKSGVLIDLLCDVADHPGQTIALTGTHVATAQNLNGPAAALHEPVTRELAVSAAVRADFPEAPSTVTLRFASLGGYIAAKSAALLARELAKDAYDLMFVIMYAPGGAVAAADAVARAEADRSVVDAAVSRFAEPNEWTRQAVELLIQAGDDGDEDQLADDVIIAARRFLGR